MRAGRRLRIKGGGVPSCLLSPFPNNVFITIAQFEKLTVLRKASKLSSTTYIFSYLCIFAFLSNVILI